MSISKGFIQLPNNFMSKVQEENLTHREFRLYLTIGTEIFRFPETRLTLSKELSSRFLQGLTGIHHSHVTRILKKFEKRGLIRIVKSHVRGQGSSIYLILPESPIGATIAPGHGATVACEDKKAGATIAPNPINQFKKDHQESEDSDSSLNSQEVNQAIEENPQETPLDSSSDTKSFLTRFEESNLNKPVINVLPAGPTATGKSDFAVLGSVLTAPSPVPMVYATLPQDTKIAPPIMSVSYSAIEEGKDLLLKKGFSHAEVTIIINRIASAMAGNDNIKSKDKYFIAACNKEVRKGNSPAGSSVHKSTGGALAVRDIQVKVKTDPIVEEKQAPPAAEVLEKIKLTAPMELYEVIMSVDNDKNIQKALQFFSSDIVKKEVLASHYVAAFKKKYPELVICWK